MSSLIFRGNSCIKAGPSDECKRTPLEETVRPGLIKASHLLATEGQKRGSRQENLGKEEEMSKTALEPFAEALQVNKPVENLEFFPFGLL